MTSRLWPVWIAGGLALTALAAALFRQAWRAPIRWTNG